jgi:hypothetical protein
MRVCCEALADHYEEDAADIPSPRHSEAAENAGPHGGARTDLACGD